MDPNRKPQDQAEREADLDAYYRDREKIDGQREADKDRGDDSVEDEKN